MNHFQDMRIYTEMTALACLIGIVCGMDRESNEPDVLRAREANQGSIITS